MKHQEENSREQQIVTRDKSRGDQDFVSVSNQFQLPGGVNGVCDPIEGNPFPLCDPRHAIWQKATLQAEEEVCSLNSNYSAGFSNSAPEFVTQLVAFFGGKFDIWAKRYFQIVLTEEDVPGFDRWLYNFANAWLADCEKKSYPVRKHVLLTELRAHLISRLEYWKAEARSRLATVAAVHAVSSPSSQAAGTVGLAKLAAEIPANVSEKVERQNPSELSNQRRGYSVEVRQWMNREGLSTVGLAAKRLHISRSALKSIMSDKGKRRYSQARLDNVLSIIRK